MSLSRRNLLKLIALGVVGHELDLDRLLWVPGKKTIFIPSHSNLTMSQIVAVEMGRVMPHVLRIFETDSAFYKLLDEKLHLDAKPFDDEYRINNQTRKISK